MNSYFVLYVFVLILCKWNSFQLNMNNVLLVVNIVNYKNSVFDVWIQIGNRI